MTKIDSNDRLICGGFAIECEISRALNQSTIAIETSERLAVIEFADALIELSAIALSNCGVNSMEIISKIRLSQSSKQSHESLFGFIASPIDTYDCNIQVGDPTTFGLFDSSETKIAALQTATENACTLIQCILSF